MTRQEYMKGLIDAQERGQASEYRKHFPWPPVEAPEVLEPVPAEDTASPTPPEHQET